MDGQNLGENVAYWFKLKIWMTYWFWFFPPLFVSILLNNIVHCQTEGDIVHGSNCFDEKIKEVEQFKRANQGLKIIYIFHKTNQTVQFFQKIQQKIVLEDGDGLIPLTNLDYVSQLIQQFQIAQNRSNPFVPVANASTANIQKDILLSVCNIPGLGQKRARKLLTEFDTLKKLSKASQLDLQPVIGENCARGVNDFFVKRNTS